MKTDNNYFITVNYHYIDDEKKFKSGIYPVSPARLSKQIDLLRKDFELIGEKEVLEFLSGDRIFKKPACLLTFDDGLKCQHKNALPVLKKKKAPAIFFVSTSHLVLNRPYSSHKVHYLLTKLSAGSFLQKIKTAYKKEVGHDLKITEHLRKEATEKKRYDDKQTAIFKYLINNHLTPILTEKIIDEIFIKTFGNEKKFCEKIYFSKKDLIAIKNYYPQFVLGLHSANHLNIPTASKDLVKKDIFDNYNYLKEEIKLRLISGMSYPYGSISVDDLESKLLDALKELNLKYAFTTHRGRNYLADNRFLLKRFDTNDAPGGKKPLTII